MGNYGLAYSDCEMAYHNIIEAVAWVHIFIGSQVTALYYTAAEEARKYKAAVV